MRTILLITAAAALATLALAAATKAQQSASSGAAQGNELPPGHPRLVGASKATCTKRRCRLNVTCDDSTADAEAPPCMFRLALLHRGNLITRPDLVLIDPEIPYQEQLPEAELVVLAGGETRTLELKTISIGRLDIKDALRKGKRKLNRGSWTATRAGVESAEGDFVFEEGDVKIKLKG
jgi:hypothetical protein